MKLLLQMSIAISVIGLSSCAEKKEPATKPANFTDQALQDPFNDNPKMEKQDIGGGSIGHYDNEGMKKDLDHVFNP